MKEFAKTYWFHVSFLAVVLIGMLAPTTIWKTHRPQDTSEPSVIIETFDARLEQFEPLWKKEIGRRFTHAVGILCHGGDFVDGQWIVGAGLQSWKHVTPIGDIVRQVQGRHPDRTVVVLACNPGHLKLGIRGVYYASSNVWVYPDRSITPEMFASPAASKDLNSIFPSEFEFNRLLHVASRWEDDPDVVGNIFEFVQD